MRKSSSDQQQRYQSAIDELTFWEDYAKAFPPGSARSQERLKEAMDAARQKVSEASAGIPDELRHATIH